MTEKEATILFNNICFIGMCHPNEGNERKILCPFNEKCGNMGQSGVIKKLMREDGYAQICKRYLRNEKYGERITFK